MKQLATLSLLVCLAFLSAFGQSTTPPAPSFTLPTAVSAVGSFDQFGSPRFSLGISAMYAPTAQSNLGMYNTTTADIFPVKKLNPATNTMGYFLNASIRQGVHEKIASFGSTHRTTFLLGADVGPGFQSTTSGISLSANASFVFTTIVKLNSWLNFVAPERMLYIPSLGFNPVIQAGLSVRLGAVK